MQLIKGNLKVATVDLNKEELLIIQQCLNEVCNGINLFEFEARIGASREEVSKLMKEFRQIISKTDGPRDFLKKQIGLALKHKIDSGSSTQDIGNWAYQIYYDYCNELEPKVEKILIDLFTMTAGPQFEYSKEQLEEIAEVLIYEDEDRVNIMNNCYDNRLFGKELKKKLQLGQEIDQIAHWAYTIMDADSFSPSLKEIAYSLALMEGCPEMAHTKEELLALAEELIVNASVSKFD